MSSVWTDLASVDVNEHTERKGKFTYLAWTFAWEAVVSRFPDATYLVLDDVVFADGSMEVRTEVTIEGKTLPMWLPVTDYNNKAIQQPNSFDVNTARMRCLTKNIAMHGLGFYIYAGESTPAPAPVDEELYEELVSLTAKESHWELREFYANNKDKMDALFNMAPNGNKMAFKNSVRQVYGRASEELKAGIAALEEAVTKTDAPHCVNEVLNEMNSIERAHVMNGLNEILRKQVEECL